MSSSRVIPFLLMLIGIIANFSAATELHFVSIEKLVEQEVGRVIIPEIYNKLGIKITIAPMPGKRAQQMANSGAIDGEIMRIYSYGDETLNTIRIPTPYYYLETMAFIRQGSNVVIHSSEDLKKYRLAKVRGVKHTNKITLNMINVHDVDSTEQMMQFLNSGHVDVALTNTLDGVKIIEKLGLSNIRPIDKPLAVLDLYHYIHKKHEHLVPKVNVIIIQMKLNGEMRNLIKDAELYVIENL
ncbi:substrate-binding periplasmic protein [Shewanella violacea]|uniref:Solute-binding protein family 3/N-terminal domain-containing protein n=1 Tax=Shewanella violacea (strain JCM 10179 / CIP 106290 / LMG 19151 / DSS12) TaxID=637905 RepID=D4ZHZ1_SHEVD|nr:transporter substrate-binding domain-containing protein [Shewanella violacea]BAJ01290.1 conserved hypothetical protein [Shewanella violacea DSS12]